MNYKRFFYCGFIITAVVLVFGNCNTASNPEQLDYSKTPIFFVHGHGMRSKCWKPIMAYLVKNGYPKKYLMAIELHPNDGSNIYAAERQIFPAIEEFLRNINKSLHGKFPNMSRKTKVDMISHSMGALSARWYTAKVRPDRVRLWISLTGANHGTNVLCGFSGQGAEDLCPAYARSIEESYIQYQLNGAPDLADVDETPYGVGKDASGFFSVAPDSDRKIVYISVRTSPDKWIKPECSPILDGTGGIKIPVPENVQARETSPGNILMTNGIGHDAILICPDTMQLIKAILSQANSHL
jgi:pimeloyl-ACP methyl ester carboxylesterase